MARRKSGPRDIRGDKCAGDLRDLAQAVNQRSKLSNLGVRMNCRETGEAKPHPMKQIFFQAQSLSTAALETMSFAKAGAFAAECKASHTCAAFMVPFSEAFSWKSPKALQNYLGSR